MTAFVPTSTVRRSPLRSGTGDIREPRAFTGADGAWKGYFVPVRM